MAFFIPVFTVPYKWLFASSCCAVPASGWARLPGGMWMETSPQRRGPASAFPCGARSETASAQPAVWQGINTIRVLPTLRKRAGLKWFNVT